MLCDLGPGFALAVELSMLLFAGMAVVLGVTSACTFPDSVQTNGTQREWKSQVRDQNTHTSLLVEFAGDRMHVISTDDPVHTFTRVCIQRYGEDRYLVAHEERGQREGRYTCLQFVMHAQGIMQVREAELSDSMNRQLCQDVELHTDEWLYLDARSATSNRHPCPIQGGFNMNVFDKSSMRSYCDGYLGQTRLESECRPKHGIYLYFREQSCVPDDMFMYYTQRVVCLVNWQEGDWRFSLVKHDRYDYMWVMRYPSSNRDRFTMYVFKDLQAPITTTITNTYNYLHISLSLDTVHTLTAPIDNPTMCRDDYEICGVLDDPCRYSDTMVLTCPRSCDLCNDNVPSLCTFDNLLQGIWAEASHPGLTSMTITEHTLHGEDGETLRCVDWGTASRWESSDVNLDEIMLVSDCRHGCRPRYRCMRVSRISTNTLFFQMSQYKMWPLTDDPIDPISCDHFVYDRDEMLTMSISSQSRAKPMRLLVSQNRTDTVRCDLNDFQTFNAEFQNNIQCSGTMSQPVTLDSFRLTMSRCSVSRLTETYHCIEFARFPPSNDLFLITRSSDGTEINCWLFPTNPSNLLLLIPSDQCNDMSKRRFRKGRLQPLAIFTKPKLVEIGINDTPNITTYMSTNGTSTPGAEESSSPLVLTALVVSIIGIQASLLITCKCCS